MAVDPLVTTDWLAARMIDPELRILDATSFMPAEKRDAAAEFAQAHIPGAAFFDIDAIADRSTDLPHMLPSAEQFGRQVGDLGVGTGDTVVVYDVKGVHSAPRAWWSLRAMGLGQVFVLDGGLPKWRAEGRPIAQGPASPKPRRFDAVLDSRLVRDRVQVADALKSGSAQLADARSPGRFFGAEPEPRPGLRSGRMPGAFNLPVASLTKNGVFLSAGELRGLAAKAGLDLDRPVIATCGSGVTAASIALALARIGAPDAAVYDGSWAEWGGREDTDVVAGPAERS